MTVKNEHIEIIGSLERMTKYILIEFDNLEINIKNTIIRNFIAKSYSLLKSIYILIKNDQERDAIAINRLLIERYLYLEYLQKTNTYEEFYNWSYIKAFESRNKMRSTPEFNNLETLKILKDSKKQVIDYQKLKTQRNKWKAPNLEKFAKEIQLDFIYKLGYDVGSDYIHPRAEEGYWDAIRLVRNEIKQDCISDTILSNSILISISMLFNGLVKVRYSWINHVERYYNLIIGYLNKENDLPNLFCLEIEIIENIKENKNNS